MAGFWSGYWQSLKSVEVEEPVDLYVHRPLAYVLARSLLNTPVSPNLITLLSLGVGLYGAYFVTQSSPHHFQWAALFCFIATVLDCADGQLARLRKTSSVIGRMLDGTTDVLVSGSVLLAVTYVMFQRYVTSWWHGVLAIALTLLMIVSTSVQTTLFDHYKTIYMKVTVPGFKEAESYAVARRNWEQEKNLSLFMRFNWWMYLNFVGNQGAAVRRFDPSTVTEFSLLGEYDESRLPAFRKQAWPMMRTWKRYFGWGSLQICITLSLLLEVPEYYILLRITLYNLVFYGPLRSRQRVASRRTMAALGLAPAAD
ncbi:MAG TPA: CDP-alcohol phosphatidyltransferase family protein [Polyangiaceae bacterium]|nr:CDP-alcohol phosphatidyltransferase family protein [Polyangiaceae bacterium]